MVLALYLATVSLAYAILAAVDHDLAESLVIAFVALLLVPTCVHDIVSWRKHRGH